MAIREVIFRGKRTDNGEWETGSLVIIRDGCSDKEVFIADKMTGYHTPVIPETVGQFTGLYDKNGKKIFEGDIVELGITYEISYIKKYARFAGRNSSCIFSSLPFDRVRVIGNIHDNSELLETAAKPAAKNIAQSGLAPASENFEIMEV